MCTYRGHIGAAIGCHMCVNVIIYMVKLDMLSLLSKIIIDNNNQNKNNKIIKKLL